MTLVLDISTSAEFWRRFYPLSRAPMPPQPFAVPDDVYLGNNPMELMPEWVGDELLDELDGTFHMLSFDPAQRRSSSARVVHAWSGPIPEGSFHQLNKDVIVISPACMFLRAAEKLDLPSLIAFGDELCGLYSFDAREPRGFRKRSVPLSTKAQLGEYIAKAYGCRGRRKAATALQYVVDRSASPMETFDEMTMCLPYRIGGYGLREFEMNYCIPLTPKAAQIAKREKCFADMYRPRIKLDIEHHGKLDHCNPVEMERDRARVNALKEMGLEVIELTAGQVGDLFAYEAIIQRIARLDGKRIDKEKLGATPERLKLRRSVYCWNKSNGCLLRPPD